MFTKTRIPKDTNCVRFYGSRAKEAYHLASLFLGGKGRIANALDVMEARIKYGFKHPIWNCYITTSSTEWFGLSREGEPFIVVMHNPGPLFDNKVLSNYVCNQKVRHDFNVVTREMFLDVFDGKYGEVELISLEYAIAKDNENNHNQNYLTKGQIEQDNLILARLGHNYDYIQVHFDGSMKENLQRNKNRPGDINTAFLECDCDEYFPQFIGLTEKPQKYILDLSNSPINLKTKAIGQFICFGSLMNVSSGMTASEIEPSNVRSDCAFLAITDEKEPIRLDKKVCMYSANRYLEKLPALFTDNVISTFSEIYDLDEPTFYQIDKFKGWYFTQRSRVKVAIGDKQKEWFVTSNPTYCVNGEPEFLVKSLKPLGRRTIKIPASEGFYTMEKVKDAFKNPSANAFQILDGFKFNGKIYFAVVEYYKAEFYFDRMIPTEVEILQDYKLLGRIL